MAAMSSSGVRARLERDRADFRAQLAQEGAASIGGAFEGRIAAVLSGGGAPGAYEAGALLAFQDARLPTHIIAATSIGSINAASYAAHSDDVVGNADLLVEAWLDLTPPAVGIEWTRYAWMLGGLVAAAAGFSNLLYDALVGHGFRIHSHHRVATWLTLGVAGTAVLLLYDHLPYLFRVAAAGLRRTSWKPEPRKLVLSAAANVFVAAFLVVVADSLHLHSRLSELVRQHLILAISGTAAAILLVAARRRLQAWVGPTVHRLLRLPLRPGLFGNYERSRLLRLGIPSERLRASPIRLLVTVTDLEAGVARCFSNTQTAQLAADPNADARFVAAEIVGVDDLMPAIIASSALPIVYEPTVLDGHTYADGAIAADEPIRPAVRLGADVIFLVMVDSPGGLRAAASTFVDVGLRALGLLMAQALLADVRELDRINALCQQVAQERGLPPEAVAIELGSRRLRYIKLFTIRPTVPLGGAVLEFGGPSTAEALLQGYREACVQVREFLAYARRPRFQGPRGVVRLAFERDLPD